MLKLLEMKEDIYHKIMTNQNFSNKIEERVKQCLDIAAKHTNLIFSIPTIQYNLKGYQAGQAYPAKWLIRFNAEMAEQNENKFIHEVAAHEVAHLVTYRMWNTLDHGKDFQKVMQWFAVEPKRCHDFEVVPSRVIRRYEYSCSCSNHQLSSIRHNRMLKGYIYKCRSCGDCLKPLFQ